MSIAKMLPPLLLLPASLASAGECFCLVDNENNLRRSCGSQQQGVRSVIRCRDDDGNPITMNNLQGWHRLVAGEGECQPCGQVLSVEKGSFPDTAQANTPSTGDLLELGIEGLADQEVISVSKVPQTLFDSAAAVFVVTQEDLRRSGVTHIAEALRMVPGMHVARVDANKWAVSTRGFNSRFANKMLVLIDGRAVYTPTFSGTFWEAFDWPLTDIERIEVIRGPGATVWGANAVNGVINIITKRAKDTQGGLLSLTVGTEERGVVDLRYGGEISKDIHIRTYGKYADRDGSLDVNDDDAGDDWQLQRGGFRADGRFSGSDIFMLQGDIYQSDVDQQFIVPSLTLQSGVEQVQDKGSFSGGWLLGRWEQTQSLSSRTALQIAFQREDRDDLLGDYRLDTFNADFQHEIALPRVGELIWGLEYRYHTDDFNDTRLLAMSPGQRDYRLFSAFVQDRFQLFDGRLEVTLGSKFEHNSFTGWEIQPTLRGLWKTSARDRFWMAISRATRTPSRVESNGALRVIGLPRGQIGALPGLVVFKGSDDLTSETLVAYEIGYRAAPTDEVSFDIAAFYNEYDDLRTADPPSGQSVIVGPDGVTLTSQILNGEEAKTYGVEVAADWRPTSWARFQLGYSFFESEFELKSDSSNGPMLLERLGDNRDPKHQLSLRSSFNLPRALEADVWLRYVDAINDVFIPAVPGIVAVDDYFTVDFRLGWRPHPDLTVSFVGRNLVDSPRVEFAQEASSFLARNERSFFGQLQWRF